ncbi:hypothetical protein [Streptomyces coeruleorubidus]|uniref:hypothetical protein n=1 Tax=Streptomyces coeruleorubidus TaxID=116188 RepID=UPI00339F0EA2
MRRLAGDPPIGTPWGITGPVIFDQWDDHTFPPTPPPAGHAAASGRDPREARNEFVGLATCLRDKDRACRSAWRAGRDL